MIILIVIYFLQRKENFYGKGSSGGKGSKPRPFNISDEEFGANMNRIFGDKTEEKEKKAKEKEEYFAKLAAETKARMESQ